MLMLSDDIIIRMIDALNVSLGIIRERSAAWVQGSDICIQGNDIYWD